MKRQRSFLFPCSAKIAHCAQSLVPSHHCHHWHHSCGGVGTQSRSRDCIGPVKGGHECPKAVDTETRDCHAPACWTEFGEWSSCSKTCGDDGIKSRQRNVEWEPRNGGKECTDADQTETTSCNKNCCRKFDSYLMLGIYGNNNLLALHNS